VLQVGTCLLKKLLEVIGHLLCLAFEVVHGGSDDLLIRIIRLLVVVALVTAGSDCNPLGSPLGPPLIAFSTPLCTLADCLKWHPLIAAGGQPPVTLDENGHDRLLTRGVPSGDVDQLRCGLWLVMTELMHQGLAVRAGPKCRNDISVTDLVELVALAGKPLNVIP
jgi:hypothetical protein